jgi:hypothetical protein
MLLKEIAPFHERLDRNDLYRFIDSWIEASVHDTFQRPEDLTHIIAALEKRYPALDHKVTKRIAKYVFEWTTARKGSYLPGQSEIMDFVNHTLERVPRAA